jgi:hypothetical protein
MVGNMGELPGAKEILEGSLDAPEELDNYTHNLIKQLQQLEGIQQSQVGISEQDNIDDPRKVKEKTTSSPSGLHYGLWKVNSTNKEINKIDTIFCNLTYKYWLVLERWKKVVDVEILKEPGNYNREHLRTICIIKGDHQLNTKRIGKQAMKMAEKEGKSLIAPEQYGSKKKHSAIEVVLNSRLIVDILRVMHKPAIIVSNDAKSCYDHISHAVFSICLQRVGCSENAVLSCTRILQSMKHHIRTAFGDSIESYQGDQDKPLQGLIQGYEPAPAGWALISTPIINMMRAEGFGLEARDPIENEVMKMVCFSFVDDTDLINSLWESCDDYQDLIEHT